MPSQTAKSSRLYQEVQESGKHLAAALAAERRAHRQISTNSSDAHLERWRMARNEVSRAVEYYALALESFREALLTELAPLMSRQV